MASFQHELLVTLPFLSRNQSGTYVCKYNSTYKAIELTVEDCPKPYTHWAAYTPLLLICLLLGLVMSVVAVVSITCLRKRRKLVITITSFPTGGWMERPEKITLASRRNFLYSFQRSCNAESEPLVPTSDSVSMGAESGESNIGDEKPGKFSVRVFRPKKMVNIETHEKFRTPPTVELTSKRPFAYKLPSDPVWEVPRSQIKFQKLAGQGRFGVVYKAELQGKLPIESGPEMQKHLMTVAIKTLHENFVEEHLVDLLRELHTMKLLDVHPNIIRLLGACTQQGWPLILLEFAVHGNLRDFLRVNRTSIEEALSGSPSSSARSFSATQASMDRGILLQFASHVANALMYLESLKLVHCDVAARNVLVTDGYVAKLSDFGFTQISNGYYNENPREHLPFRWIAPECFETHQFTSKSDVWAFGILLWEIFTLGNTPYPHLATEQIADWLALGNRNSQPALASEAVYDLMLSCWCREGSLRPTFKHLLTSLHTLLPERLSCVSSDSGVSSGHRSRQSSQPDSSYNGRPHKPIPPLRTCSLPGYGNSPKGYIEMHCCDYLQPRSDLRVDIVPEV